MKKLFLIILLFSIAIVTTAQHNSESKRANKWYFGDGAGIDFSSGTPVPDLSSSMYAAEGCGVMSDTQGNLLFYSNGISVWNKNHQVMPNGTGLISRLLKIFYLDLIWE